MNEIQRAPAVNIGTKLLFGAVAISLISAIIVHDSRSELWALCFLAVFCTPVLMLVPAIYILVKGRIAFRKKLPWLLALAVVDLACLFALVVSIVMMKSAQIIPWPCVLALAPGYVAMHLYRKRVVKGSAE